MIRVLLTLLAVSAAVTLGCSKPEWQTVVDTANTPVAQRDTPATIAEYPSLQNLLQVSATIYSGGEPHADAAFSELQRLGIKTVVSVDGIRPDIETAHRYGLRYVHIPIGYDGLEASATLSLARLVRETDGPIYIHCHHGRHRGPTAAAIAGMASGAVDNDEAIQILERAGTDRNYAGLWRAVETYRPPALDAQLPELVEIAEVDSFAAAMARIDREFDELVNCRDAGWMAPASHPDLLPHQQALLLKEQLRESRRSLPTDANPELRMWLVDAESQAEQLEHALVAEDGDTASQCMSTLSAACTRCHERFRN